MAQATMENVRWTMTIYPWENNYPNHDRAKMFNELDPFEVKDGILSLQLHRSKDNPYGICDFNFFGPIPAQMFIGNWVLVRSFNGVNDGDDGVVRFFGQIYNLKTSYQVSASGGLSQYTIVTVREWSFLYSVPVRFDSYAFLNTITDARLKFTNQAEYLAKDDAKNIRLSDIGKVTTDPFQFCAMTLRWIGALSGKGLKQIEKGETYSANFGSTSLENMTLPDVALLLPKIPRKLLRDLGVSEDDQKEPFKGDFVTQVFGVLDKPISQFDQNLGVFKGDSKTNAIDMLPKSYVLPTKRPSYSNILPLFVQGESAWQLLSQGCDRFVNEVYTDLYYYKEKDKVKTRPLIVFRDKPFLLQANKDSESLSTNWSIYDCIPRITVSADQIERFDIDHSFTLSPNYLRVQYMPEGVFQNDMLRTQAEINSTFRLPAEMLRYGGQTSYIQTPYVSVDNGFLPLWYRDVATMHSYWEGMRYRTPNAQLIVRDTNACYSVGMNIRIPIGKHVFVGHLVGFSITYSRNSEGTHRTTTVLNLERLVMETPDDASKLTYIPEELIRNIFFADARVGKVDLSVSKNVFQSFDKAAAQFKKLMKAKAGIGAKDFL